jgi:acyl carrier protein
MEFEAFKKVAATVLGMDPEEIEYDMTFHKDLGADSLDLYQIFMGVEDELNITIPSDGLDRITTVGQAVELIEKVNGKPS